MKNEHKDTPPAMKYGMAIDLDKCTGCGICWNECLTRRTPQLKLIKIGARVVRHARAITFQLAEVAASGPMVRAVIAAIRRLRAPPATKTLHIEAIWASSSMAATPSSSG